MNAWRTAGSILGGLLLVSLRAAALTVSITVDGRSFVPGQAIHCWVAYLNDSPNAIYLAGSVISADALELVGPDGARLRYLGPWGRPSAGPDSSYRRLGPGDAFVFHKNLLEGFEISHVGMYRLWLYSPNEEPERAMATPDYRFSSAISGAPAIDLSLLARGPIVSPEVFLAIENTGSPVDNLVNELARGGARGLDEIIYRNAAVITRADPQSLYGGDIAAGRIERLIRGLEEPSARRRQTDALRSRPV